MLINIQTRHFHSSINHREQSFHKALITGYLRPMNIAKFLRTGFFIVTQVFSCEVGKIFKSTFSYRTPPVTASALPVAASVFFLKKYYLIAISQSCYDVLIIFSSRYIVWCIKSRTLLFINLSSIVRFSE